MIHNNEGSLIFSDSRDSSKLFNCDLETGKIVEEFCAEKGEFSDLTHLTNSVKNG
jgi:hypothetical protein